MWHHVVVTYTGTTTLNSGNLYLTSSGSVGSGPIIVPGYYSTPSLLAPAESAITLANNISVSNAGLNLGASSGGTGSFREHCCRFGDRARFKLMVHACTSLPRRVIPPPDGEDP